MYVGRYPGTLPPKDMVARADNAARLLTNRRVVIVDDDPFFRSLLKVMLEQAGLQNTVFLEAETSDEAAAILQTRVDLVLCDMNLASGGSKSGLEIIREFRRANPDVPAYMVTADCDEPLIEKVRAAGATGHILKPINLRVLRRILVSDYFGHTPPADQHEPEAKPETRSSETERAPWLTA